MKKFLCAMLMLTIILQTGYVFADEFGNLNYDVEKIAEETTVGETDSNETNIDTEKKQEIIEEGLSTETQDNIDIDLSTEVQKDIENSTGTEIQKVDENMTLDVEISDTESVSEINMFSEENSTELVFTGGWTNGTNGILLSSSFNEAYTFTSDGYGYTILDEDGENYYLYCCDSYGKVKLDGVPQKNYFEVDDVYNIGYWLNNDFYSGAMAQTAGLAIDVNLKNYIVEHNYFIESSGANDNGKYVNCKITLLSYTDIMNYYDRIGYQSTQFIGTIYSPMALLRTPMYTSGSIRNQAFLSMSTGNISNANPMTANNYGPFYIRPSFYISKEYFKNVKLDTYGMEVANILKENNSREELENLGYSIRDIAKIYSSDISEDNGVSVDNLAIYGITKPGYTLEAEYDLSKNCSKELSIISWHRSSSDNGDFIEIATGDTYSLRNEDANQYIKMSVFPMGDNDEFGKEIFSEAVYIDAALTKCSGYTLNGTKYTLNAHSNSNYTFLDGEYRYICLEAEENGVYAYSDNVAGLITLPAKPATNMFNPETYNTISYWLNNEYLKGEKGKGGKPINPNIVDYLLPRDYLTEGCSVEGTEHQDDYVVRCKVALLSYNELLEYQDRIGYEALEGPVSEHTYDSSVKYVLRTPIKDRTTHVVYLNPANGSLNSCSPVDYNYTHYDIRTCMLIGYDYFKNNKIDLNTMGDAVKEMIRSNITYDELSDIYTEEELRIIGYEETAIAPSKYNMTGIYRVGQMLSLDGSAAAGTANVAYEYIWYYSKTQDGPYREIDGANQKGFVIENRFMNKYIKGKVKIYSSLTSEKYGEYSCMSGKIAEKLNFAAIPSYILNDTLEGKCTDIVLVNDSDEEVAVNLIIAAFDSDNIMTSYSMETVNVAPGTNTYLIDIETNTAELYRVMAWNVANKAPFCGITIK